MKAALVIAISTIAYLVNLEMALEIFQRSLCHERVLLNTWKRQTNVTTIPGMYVLVCEYVCVNMCGRVCMCM